MNTTEQLDFFFGNLSRMMSEAGVSKRRLAYEIGVDEGVVNTMMTRRTAPTLEMVYGIAGALKIDVADLLRPGPQIGVSSGGSENYWAERTAEEFLTNELSKSRDRAAHEAPSFDAVLSWWHANEGRLTNLDGFSKFIELFEFPDSRDMKPRPTTIGEESLSSRELGRNSPELLSSIFESSGPDIARAIAQAHMEVVDGQPKLSVHTIFINMSSGNIVKLTYSRLLLPVTDGNGHKYVMNYSKPIRRSEIGREKVDHLDPVHRSDPVITGIV